MPRTSSRRKVLFLRLPPRLAAAVREAAEERGWTLSRWCENAFETVLRQGRPEEPEKPQPAPAGDPPWSPSKPPRSETL